ncbi:MAG: HD domain-containing phosphohydrolase [Pseudomonadota bacterium]
MAHVLIVDDEQGIRKTLGMFLERDGHEVATAADGESARGLFEEGSWDVVVTDIVMPGAGGVDLLRELKERAPLTQVVLITGEPSVDTASEAVRLGAFDYLPKPISRMEICRVVAAAAAHGTLLGENQRLAEENEACRHRLEEFLALESGKLAEEVDSHHATIENLRRALGATIEAMARTVEMRDPYTAGHQRRVADLARAIATALSLAEVTRDAIRMAASIHDIGKVAIPAEILSRPRKLTSSEFSLVREHVRFGYELLSPIDFPWPVASIVRQHHERLDGSGYPEGLSGVEIRLEARILAVADVVEAISSHRPYRPALGTEAALDEITRHRNTLYDPEVVDACCRAIRDGFLFKR